MHDFSIKKVYIDKLDKIVNKYNNIYHKAIKLKSVDVNPSMYIGINKENNKEGPTFKVGVHVGEYARISLQNAMFQIGLKKFLWTYVISGLNSKEFLGTFYEK